MESANPGAGLPKEKATPLPTRNITGQCGRCKQYRQGVPTVELGFLCFACLSPVTARRLGLEVRR